MSAHPFVSGCLSLLLIACQSQPYSQQAITPIRNSENMAQVADQHLRHFIGFPTPTRFSVCHSLTCHRITEVSLTEEEWQAVTSLFFPAALSAEDERLMIQQAIALLEQIVGEKIGTQHDHAKNDLYGSRYGQLDCVDEATNSTVYLRLFEQAGLLHWHETAPRTSRGLVKGLAPHNTASITDKASQIRYAVDSWYKPNGALPHIVPMTDWKAGWQPKTH